MNIITTILAIVFAVLGVLYLYYVLTRPIVAYEFKYIRPSQQEPIGTDLVEVTIVNKGNTDLLIKNLVITHWDKHQELYSEVSQTLIGSVLKRQNKVLVSIPVELTSEEQRFSVELTTHNNKIYKSEPRTFSY